MAAGEIKACKQEFPGMSCLLPALLVWDLGLVDADITAACSSAPTLEGETAILCEECRQSIISLSPEDKEIFLLWTWSLTGCNEITAICNGWKSFGSCPGGGSLEGMAVPWQGMTCMISTSSIYDSMIIGKEWGREGHSSWWIRMLLNFHYVSLQMENETF